MEVGLANEINKLRRGETGELIAQRMREFKDLGRKGAKEWFSELCYCILTANSTARLGMEIQRELGSDGFFDAPA